MTKVVYFAIALVVSPTVVMAQTNLQDLERRQRELDRQHRMMDAAVIVENILVEFRQAGVVFEDITSGMRDYKDYPGQCVVVRARPRGGAYDIGLGDYCGESDEDLHILGHYTDPVFSKGVNPNDRVAIRELMLRGLRLSLSAGKSGPVPSQSQALNLPPSPRSSQEAALPPWEAAFRERMAAPVWSVEEIMTRLGDGKSSSASLEAAIARSLALVEPSRLGKTPAPPGVLRSAYYYALRGYAEDAREEGIGWATAEIVAALDRASGAALVESGNRLSWESNCRGTESGQLVKSRRYTSCRLLCRSLDVSWACRIYEGIVRDPDFPEGYEMYRLYMRDCRSPTNPNAQRIGCREAARMRQESQH